MELGFSVRIAFISSWDGTKPIIEARRNSGKRVMVFLSGNFLI